MQSVHVCVCVRSVRLKDITSTMRSGICVRGVTVRDEVGGKGKVCDCVSYTFDGDWLIRVCLPPTTGALMSTVICFLSPASVNPPFSSTWQQQRSTACGRYGNSPVGSQAILPGT